MPKTIQWRRARQYRVPVFLAALVFSLAALGGAGRLPTVLAADPFTATYNTYSGENGCHGSVTANPYTVPTGIRFVQVVAIGGSGAPGFTYDDGLLVLHAGGAGGGGAKVTAVVAVTPGQKLWVVVGHNGDSGDPSRSFPNGGAPGFFFGGGGGSSSVSLSPSTSSVGNTCDEADRDGMLVVAGGGGGGGGASVFNSGGSGGNAGNADFSGADGSTGFGDGCVGGGGGGASNGAVGTAGDGGCDAPNGEAGSGFRGGRVVGSANDSSATSAGGAGGGGWTGGGSGGVAVSIGGGGGGAGSSLVNRARSSSVSTDSSRSPSVTITALFTPQTTATANSTGLGDWYTVAPAITLTATDAGGPGVGHTYYALDNDFACGPISLTFCHVYTAPFSVSTNGLHTLSYFSVDTAGLDEEVHSKSFAVSLTTASLGGTPNIASGTNPTSSTGGVTASGTGNGLVGTAVYLDNPGTRASFNSSGAYVDVIVAGGLTSLTIKDCYLNGGTDVYWYDGTNWGLVSNQTYDAAAGCVTITINGTTVPNLSQVTGTPLGAGSPPSTTAVATTADGNVYNAQTWTNQSVTVTFTCSPNSAPSSPVTRVSDGRNQSASGTCTDGLGQTGTTQFTGINVDKTPPTCSILVSPTVLWPANGKPVAISGTATVADNLSGIASVVGGPVTSNELLASGDVQGFVINSTIGAPLNLSDVVNITGQLKATRTGSGSGRTYSQAVTVRDQAGNKQAGNCGWTVTVPHDQKPNK